MERRGRFMHVLLEGDCDGLVYNVLLWREGEGYHGFLALIIMAIAYINPFWRSRSGSLITSKAHPTRKL